MSIHVAKISGAVTALQCLPVKGECQKVSHPFGLVQSTGGEPSQRNNDREGCASVTELGSVSVVLVFVTHPRGGRGFSANCCKQARLDSVSF